MLAKARNERCGVTWIAVGGFAALAQTDERERVKARIKALTERTVARGCTEAEAMAAAEMVGRLLERYALTMQEVDVREEPCVQVEVPIGGLRRRPIDLCTPAIARFCDCRVWLARGEAGAHYVFFGFATDTRLAAYLFSVIERAMRSELQTFRRQTPALVGVVLRAASTSFQQGMAGRIAERLETMHAEREATVAAALSSGTALIVMRHQVVEDAFRASKVRLQSSGGITLRRNAAYRAGRVAGDRINLARPLGANATARLV
ncbi:MAG: DUF2786 domain-containing protein [Proteobacteria bacterium]|nr:DUF2786 domain-containing protein [Pseudomonadota bacterium]